MNLRIKHRFSNALRMIGPNYLSYLGGIMVSAAMGVYIEVLSSTGLKWPYGFIGGSFLLLSSFMLTALSLKLQELHELAMTGPPAILKSKERDAIHLKLISESFVKLMSLVCLSLLLTCAGMLFLGFAR